MGNNNTTASNTNNGNAIEDMLRHMVDDRDWAGIDELLQEKDNAKTEAFFVFGLLTDRSPEYGDALIIDLLKDRDDEEAVELISTLITMGGQELVMRTFGLFNEDGNDTLLHAVCRYNKSIDLISQLIHVGGKALVLEEDTYGWTALHYALYYDPSNDVLLKFIEVGGEELLLAKNNDSETSLQIAVEYALNLNRDVDDDSIATINHLIQYGGAEILTQRNNKGMTPLESIITKECPNWFETQKETFIANCSHVASLLIKKGIELQVGGDYSIGGLLSTSSSPKTKEKIYNKWDSIVLPALEQVMTDPHNHNSPILQALIVHEATKNIIKDAINRFPHSINTQDSFGQYPIDLAVQHGLAWDGGLQDIVDAYASSQQTTALHVCAKHGVQWENGTKEMLEGSALDVVERVDDSTGLYLFMTAALGDEKSEYDLDSIFKKIKPTAKSVR